MNSRTSCAMDGSAAADMNKRKADADVDLTEQKQLKNPLAPAAAAGGDGGGAAAAGASIEQSNAFEPFEEILKGDREASDALKAR